MINGHKIGFMPSGSYGKQPVAAICESLKKIGYDAVEWHHGFFCPRSHTYDELKEMVSITEKSGLEISEIVVQQDLVMTDTEKRKDNIEYVKQCIEVFASLGIKAINLFTGPVPWNRHPLIIGSGISEGDAWNMVLRAFREFVPLSEKNQLHLAVENVWGMLCHDFYTAKFLIDYFNSPYLGVNYDPSHDILAGNMDVGWIVRQWGRDRIKHVHLKDAVGTQIQGQFVFPLPGEGFVDWKSFIAAVDDIGYEGVMSVEFESFEYLKKILCNDMEKAAWIAYENFCKLFGND